MLVQENVSVVLNIEEGWIESQPVDYSYHVLHLLIRSIVAQLLDVYILINIEFLKYNNLKWEIAFSDLFLWTQ